MRTSIIKELLGRVWDKISLALTVLGLIDVTSQLVEWAEFIHWIVQKYKIWRDWLFYFLPFHIPEEWRNYVVILGLAFSVTNIGYYKRTGKLYILQLITMLCVLILGLLQMLPNSFFKDDSFFTKTFFSKVNMNSDKLSIPDVIDDAAINLSEICFVFAPVFVAGVPIIYVVAGKIGINLISLWDVAKWTSVALMIVGSGALIAWRWIIGTTLTFAGLLAVNEIYTHWWLPLHTAK